MRRGLRRLVGRSLNKMFIGEKTQRVYAGLVDELSNVKLFFGARTVRLADLGDDHDYTLVVKDSDAPSFTGNKDYIYSTMFDLASICGCEISDLSGVFSIKN